MNLLPPGVYPPLNEEEINNASLNGSHAEFLVCNVLGKQAIESGWFVLRSFHIEDHPRNHSGEIDFLVITDRALICIEVKGSSIKTKNGGFQSYHRGAKEWREIKNPFQQSKECSYSVVDLLKLIPHVKRRLLVAWCVWFPEMSTFHSGLEFDDWRTGLSSDLENAEFFIKTVVEESSAKFGFGPPETLSSQSLNALVTSLRRIDHAQIYEDRIPFLPAFVALKNELKILTNSQKLVLDGLKVNKHVLLYGGAGTGKTFLARYAALSEANNGRQVCFFLRSERLKNKIFESYAGIDLSKCSLSLYTFDDIIQKGISHFLNYQVLIIDEFQDFLKFDFAAELISSFSSRKTRFFGDHINQSISESEIQLEEFFNETTLTPILFNLNLNIRNTKEIIDGTKKILNVEEDDSYNSNSIRGVPIKYTVLNSIEKAVKEIINRHQRTKPSVLIACLNSLDELDEIYNLTLSYDFITVLTANESKGLEWDYGYVFKLRSYPDKTEIKELYVALTRSLVYSEVFYELSGQDFSVLQFISENG